MGERLRAGVVGCGMVAQAMHLPSLRALGDRFEVAALCDLDAGLVERVADRHGIGRRFTAVEDLLGEPLDVLLVLSNGDHAPAVRAGLRAGLHVFVEKPICLGVDDGLRICDEAEAAGRRLMVGFMKRFDPAYVRACEVVASLGPLRLVTTTTLEAPFLPYIAHHRLLRGDGPPPATAEALRRERDATIATELPGGDALVREMYAGPLTQSLIHELDMLRGALGEPESVDHAQLRPGSVVTTMTFGGAPVVVSWADVGTGITSYRQSLSFSADSGRVTLDFPSPYLRHAPTRLRIETGAPGTASSAVSEEIVSYDEAFENELVEFHEAVTQGRSPRTAGRDGVRDIALARAVALSHLQQAPVQRPTEVVAPGGMLATEPRSA